MKDLIERYEELSSKKIKTEEDIKALSDLEEQLKTFGEDEEFVVLTVQGEIDWESSIDKLNATLKSNEIEIQNNLAEIFSHAVQLGFRKGFTPEIKKEIASFIVSDFG
jgi:aspartyl-tRNA synthetase